MRCKRLLALLMMLVMLGSFVPAEVYATEVGVKTAEAKLSVISVDGNEVFDSINAGSKVVVAIAITKNPGMSTAGFTIEYDENKLTLDSIALADGVPGTASVNGAKVLWDHTEDFTGTGTFIVVSFTVNEGAHGEIEVNLAYEEGDISNYDEEDIELTITPCTITVAGGGEKPNVPATGVTLDKTTLELTEGQEEQLTATVVPETATTRTVKWTSDSEQVTVDENGKVKALYYTAGSTGKATVTVTTDNGGYTAVCKVTVKHGELTYKPYEAASCTKEGHQAYWFCDTCKHYYTDVNGAPGEETTSASVIIPTSPHTLEPVAEKAATCTTGGNVAYWKCSVCGKAFKDANGSQPTTVEAETLDALGHDYTVTGHDDTNHWKACSRCNEKDASSVAAHTLVVVVKKTYADGSPTHEVQCSVCAYNTERAHEADDGDVKNEWKHDGENHWREYGCGTIMNKESHT